MTTSSPACARCPPMIEPSDPAPRMRTFITPNAHAQPPDGDHPEPTVRSSVLDNRRSFYYLIRPQQERWRDVESQSLRSLEIDHQLELRGLLDRQVGGFRSLQNLVHVGGEESIPPPFFFTDTATTEIYTLSLHDALPSHSRTSR